MDQQTARKFGLVEPQRLAQTITNRELSKILKMAANDARSIVGRVVGRPTIGEEVRRQQMIVAARELDTLATRLWSQTGHATAEGIRDAEKLAADQSIEMDEDLGMPEERLSAYKGKLYFSAEQSALDILSRRTNGHTLAEGIYANGKVSTAHVADILDKGLVLQKSSREIAKEVVGYFAPDVPGGASYAAMRLARTEINNAHHETSVILSKDKPWIIGFKWNLSGSHARPDECNDYSERDHDGLGIGIFKKGDVPNKPHPQCLCYLTHMQMSESDFKDSLLTGKFNKYTSGS